MFCEECGREIEDGSLFCENCGAKVGAVPNEGDFDDSISNDIFGDSSSNDIFGDSSSGDVFDDNKGGTWTPDSWTPTGGNTVHENVRSNDNYNFSGEDVNSGSNNTQGNNKKNKPKKVKRNNNNSPIKLMIIIISAVIVLTGLGVGGYYGYKMITGGKTNDKKVSEVTPEPSPSNDSGNNERQYSVYSNAKYGVSIFIPQDFISITEEGKDVLLSEVSNDGSAKLTLRAYKEEEKGVVDYYNDFCGEYGLTPEALDFSKEPFEFNAETDDKYCYLYAVKHDSNVLCIKFSCDKSDKEKYTECIDKICNSINFK